MKNSMKTIVALALLLLVILAFAACKNNADVTPSDSTPESDSADGGNTDTCTHAYDNACDTTCNTCGATRTVMHTHATTLTAGDITHYYSCSVCGDKKDEAAHAFTVQTADNTTLKAEATPTAKAQYWKSCACGKLSTTEYFESGKIAALISDIQNIDKTYDTEKVANPTYTTNSDGTVSFAWYTNSGSALTEAPAKAGQYKVKISIAETDTYAGVIAERSFTIAKATPTITNVAVSPVEIKYGDSYTVNHDPIEGEVTFAYKVRGAADSTYTATAPTDVGEYTARATVAETENYTGASATVDFEIAAYVFSGLDTSVVYNGSNVHEIDLSDMGMGDIVLRVTFNDSIVGSYPTDVEVLENGSLSNNYEVDNSTCTVTIEQKTLGVMWTAPTSLRFDGEEKIPTATLTGVVAGDECTADIEKNLGDNVWFGETFTYRVLSLTGTDADNYKLPDNTDSPAYEITIDESVSVGEEADVGSVWWVDNVLPYTMYYSIDLQCGYYYFDYVSDNQGVSFVFELYAKGDTATPIATYEVDENSTTSVAFEIETDGVYYVKVVSTDEGQYETLTIRQDTHESKDSYGFCAHGCGEYLGEELDTNSWETVTLGGDNSKTAYYRFEDGGDYLYSLKYLQGDNENMTVKCYRTDNNGNFVEVTLGGSLISSFDDYYYLTFRLNAIGSGATKTFTFQVEQTLF